MDGRGDERRSGRQAADRVLVLNPVSGSGEHPPEIRREARERGFEVRETEAAGDGRRLAREAATAGVSLVAVAGGDGTVNEVVHGIAEADAFEAVDVAIVPAGTANLFARSLEITSIDRGFELLDRGNRRRIDVGFAGERPFLNTCLAGVVARAETTAPSGLKRRLGVFAYLVTTLGEFPEYEGIPVEVTFDGGEPGNGSRSWRGDALLVLVGNAFRIPEIRRRDQPSATDGLLEVTVLGDRPPEVTANEGTVSTLLESSLLSVTREETPSLSVRHLERDPITFSLDGELLSATTLDITVRKQCLSLYADPLE